MHCLCVYGLCAICPMTVFLVYPLFLFYHTFLSKPFSVTLWPMISGLCFVYVLSYLVTNFIVICSVICGLCLSADPPCCSVHHYGSTTSNYTATGFDPTYSWSWLTKSFAQPRKNLSEPSITMPWHFWGVDLQKGKLIHQQWIVPSKSQCSIPLGS